MFLLIIGLHRAPYHHTGAAVIKETDEGLEVVAISQERLDRIKDSGNNPDVAIDYCLNAVGVGSLDDVDLIVSDYIYKPDLQNDRQLGLRNALSMLKRNFKDFDKKHAISEEKVRFVNHHMAHACSAFYPSGFSDSAVLIVDGHGTLMAGIDAKEKDPHGAFETQSIFIAEDGKIKRLASSSMTGIGMFYSAFTYFLGFGNMQEGKTMGLAPLGADFRENYLKFSQNYCGIDIDYSDLVNIWGEDRNFVKAEYLEPCRDKQHQTNPYYSRIAWEVQNETEKAMLHLAHYARELTGNNRLCLAGGVALNSVANYAIKQAGVFNDIWVQPASSDTGIPLGCALYGYYHLCEGRKRWEMKHAYLGRNYTQDEIKQAIQSVSDVVAYTEDTDYKQAANLLASGKIVGWFHGGSEYGPRALGHRSILVDPRKAKNKDTLNARVKFREAFRPFAPVVPEEHAHEYFDLDKSSPFMLMVAPIRSEKQDIIPAVTHVDGTGRVQTVTKRDNGLFYDLVVAFGKMTGVPVLLNTSFNVAGDPIVETPEDAIRCFLNTNIDVLILDHFLLRKK